MTARKLHDVIIECIRRDIANQPDMDAIVNASNAGLRPGVALRAPFIVLPGLALKTSAVSLRQSALATR